ncbi:Chitin synthase, class 2 [Podochytrium sp. JEL0797]|nr:Chitin synthase, class 2 [Podochytrium sp. JEL0797]
MSQPPLTRVESDRSLLEQQQHYQNARALPVPPGQQVPGGFPQQQYVGPPPQMYSPHPPPQPYTVPQPVYTSPQMYPHPPPPQQYVATQPGYASPQMIYQQQQPLPPPPPTYQPQQQQQQQQQQPPPNPPQTIAGATTVLMAPALQQVQQFAQTAIERIQGYAPMLLRGPRMSKQDVRLTDGNFVVNVPLSNEYLKHIALKDSEEFTHLRYTAATTDANEFAKSYVLRQVAMKRKTRIAVVCTMYAEDDILFSKTMSAVHDNIAYLCSGHSNGRGWGPDSWKEIVVVIVSDGRAKVHPKTLDVLSVMGCYMEGLPRASVNDNAVTAHVFEFSTQVRVNSHLVTRFGDEPVKAGPLCPMQTIFLLKEKNAKKINSHRWFFKAVCDQLDPEICILIDVGTKPTERSFYHLYRAFERNTNVAGACGEIAAELGPWWKNLINPLVAVQNFEYKMSNILDKPLESMFGYISVLPGAFSAYRYKALLGKPLDCYFKGEQPHGTNVSEANMYLAEDRILCFELVMRRDARYVLKYVKSAKAETDVPSEFSDLIKQRRRWLNGSFFATVHALANTGRIFSSGHTVGRKILLLIEAIYNGINLLFSWFMIGNMYLSFYFLFNIAGTDSLAACSQGIVDAPGIDPFYPYGGAVSGVLRAVYMGSFMAMVIASMGNRPEAIKTMHLIFAVIFGILMIFMVFMGVWTIKNDIQQYLNLNHVSFPGFFKYMHDVPNFRNLVVSVLSTYVLYILSSLLAGDPYHTVTCILQYLIMIPSFTNILMVYAFCNIHDVSWGTKGITSASVLPDVKISQNSKGETVATVELPAQNKDSDEWYVNALHKLNHEAAHLHDRKDDGPKDSKTDDDFFKGFRTFVVLFWFFSNFLLVFVFTNTWVINKIAVPGQVNPFLSFLLWSVAGLSMIRFLASTAYLIEWSREQMQDFRR